MNLEAEVFQHRRSSDEADNTQNLKQNQLSVNMN